MNTTSTANVDAMNTLTATAANTLRINDNANPSPFFRLPRELRDEIYDLVAMDEQTLYRDVTLRSDEPAQKTTYADRGVGNTFPNSQFEVEYSAAIERRFESLVGAGDYNGFHLSAPGWPEFGPNDIWLAVSSGQQKNGRIRHNPHTFVLTVPMWPFRGPKISNNKGDLIRLGSCVEFAFKFPEKAELGPRLRLECYWDRRDRGGGECILMACGDNALLPHVLDVAKEMNWRGSVREYMLWQRYVEVYVRRGLARGRRF